MTNCDPITASSLDVSVIVFKINVQNVYLAVGQLVDGGDQLPDVAEDKEPHDGDGDPRQPAFLLLPHGVVVAHEGVPAEDGGLAVHPVDVVSKNAKIKINFVLRCHVNTPFFSNDLNLLPFAINNSRSFYWGHQC